MRENRRGLILLIAAVIIVLGLPHGGLAVTKVLNVPSDFPTIQSAVNAANPGDYVLVAPGTYNEAVEIETAGITVRGTNRNTVLIDGEFTRANGIVVRNADNVSIENLTVCCFQVNGVHWVSSSGYTGRYLTAYNNGLYGVFAFDSSGPGLFENSYGSGHPDAGFYIGQCDPCGAIVRNVISEKNALGWSGTNASDVTIVDSEFKLNALGVVPNTLNSEAYPPATGGLIIGNSIHDNGKTDVPGTSTFGQFYGVGIALVGTVGVEVTDNEIINNNLAGIVLVTYPDSPIWPGESNEITSNVIDGHSIADIGQATLSATGNCWSDNAKPGGGNVTAAPEVLETAWSCSLPDTPPGGDPRVEFELAGQFAGEVRDVDYKTMPVPPQQPSMPNALSGLPGTDPIVASGGFIRLPATGAALFALAGLGILALAGAIRLSRYLRRDSR